MSWPTTVIIYPDVRTHHADKRWGRGRLIQLATRMYCAVRGHRMREWTYDWDDTYWDDGGPKFKEEFKPGENEVLLWYRGCKRGCGTVQDAHCTLKRRKELPS